MRNTKRFALTILLCIMVFTMIAPISASAETPYVTYTIDGYGSIRQTQTAYLAHSTITKFGEGSYMVAGKLGEVSIDE